MEPLLNIQCKCGYNNTILLSKYISETKNNNSTIPLEPRCLTHNKIYCNYCKDCKSNFCNDCIAHSTHKTTKITDINIPRVH